jgi:hypothetical protein
VFGDFGIDEFATACLERSESAFLVNAHQPAVAGNVGSEDGSQPPLDTRLGHKYRPPYRDLELSLRPGAKCVYQGNDVRVGSWLCENSKIEFADRKFVSIFVN